MIFKKYYFLKFVHYLKALQVQTLQIKGLVSGQIHLSECSAKPCNAAGSLRFKVLNLYSFCQAPI